MKCLFHQVVREHQLSVQNSKVSQVLCMNCNVEELHLKCFRSRWIESLAWFSCRGSEMSRKQQIFRLRFAELNEDEDASMYPVFAIRDSFEEYINR